MRVHVYGLQRTEGGREEVKRLKREKRKGNG